MAERIDTAIRFLLYLLIFWLPYSIAVVELSIVLAFLLFIFKKIYLKQMFGIPKTPLDLGILFFVGAGLLSVLGSVYLMESFHGFLTKTLEWFVVFYLIVEVFNKPKYFQIALGVFVFTAFSTSLDALYQFYVSGKDIFLGHEIVLGSRATAGFRTSNDLSGYLIVFVPVIISLFFVMKTAVRKGIVLFILMISLWALSVTFTRAAWLATAVSLIFLFLTLLKARKLFLYVFVGCLILAGGLIIFSHEFSFLEPFIGHRFNTIIWRGDVWKDILEMIAEAPFFGHGVNTFMKLFQFYNVGAKFSPTYAHNCYLQLTAEMGLIGLGAFLGIIYIAFKNVLDTIGLHWTGEYRWMAFVSCGLLSGVLGFLVQSFFDTNFYALQLSIYFWLSIGILISINKVLDKNSLYGINKP